jgi:hypothetical protein
MSNGVGVTAALTGSLPPIAPSLNPDLDEGVRPPAAGRSPDSVTLRKRPGRSVSPSASVRGGGDTASMRGLRLRPTPTDPAGKMTSPDSRTKSATLPSDALRRISTAGNVAQARGASSLRLTLRPASLGTLTIDLSMRGSLLRGRIRTETPAARELILGQLDRLREALEGQGIRVGDLEVQVGPQARRQAGEGASEDGNPEADAPEAATPRSVRRQKLDVLA